MALKKKVVTSKKASASVKKTLPKKSRTSQTPVVSYQRIVIFTACAVLALVAVMSFNKPAVTQSVAGISVARGFFAQTTIDLPEIDGAVAFNIYYKEANETSYDHAVRNIPVGTSSYTISYLKKGTAYDYKIVAVDASGKEFWFGSTQILDNLVGM